MKVTLYLALFFLFNCCENPKAKTQDQPNADVLITEVKNKTIQFLRKEKKLCACGFGSGGMDQIRMLALSFNYYDEIDIDQARELLVVAGTKFLSTINSNEKLRPFLKNTPFTTENIEIRIFVQKPNGKEPDQGKLTVLSMVDGILSYKVDNPETNRFRTILKETFEEAEAKRICIPCTSSQEAL